VQVLDELSLVVALEEARRKPEFVASLGDPALELVESDSAV